MEITNFCFGLGIFGCFSKFKLYFWVEVCSRRFFRDLVTIQKSLRYSLPNGVFLIFKRYAKMFSVMSLVGM